jgi:hypothetical protein
MTEKPVSPLNAEAKALFKADNARSELDTATDRFLCCPHSIVPQSQTSSARHRLQGDDATFA